MAGAQRNRTDAGAYLLHPVVWLAIAVLVINDHVLKALVPGWVTGKLSDVAGLIFFPLILAGLVDLGAHTLGRDLSATTRRRLATVAALATGVVFAGIQLWPAMADLYLDALSLLQWPYHAVARAVHGEPLPALVRPMHTADPSDLIALPALVVPLWIARRR